MSSRSDHWCWSQEDVTGAELLVMLAISDRADENGFGSFQSMDTIGRKAKMSERNARRIVTDLEARGKLERNERPGRTTEVHIVIPEGFGRRRPRTDNLSPQTPDNTSSLTQDTMSGGQGEATLSGAPDNLSGGADKLSADSSLPIFPSDKSKDARPRAGPGPSPARAGESPVHGDELVLKNRAMLAGITPQLPDEPRDRFLRRLADGEGRMVLVRAEQHRRDRESAAPDPNSEQKEAAA